MKCVFPLPFATMSESRLPVTQRWEWKCGHKENPQCVHIYIHHDTVTTVRSFWLQIRATTLKHTAHVWKKCLYTSKRVSDQTAVFLQRDYSPCVFHFCVANELMWPAKQRTAFRVRVRDAITASGPADSVQLLASGSNDFFHIRHWPISQKCISHDWRKASFVNNHGLKYVQFLKVWLHTYLQELVWYSSQTWRSWSNWRLFLAQIPIIFTIRIAHFWCRVNMNMYSNLTTCYDNVTHASSCTKEQLDTTS